jgi:hypothetical protein
MKKSLNEQYHLTDEQIDAATRFIDLATRQVLYIVKSASDPEREYKVTYNRNFNRFACECKASQLGLSCWHMRSAFVNELMYRQAKRDEAEAQVRIAEEKAEYERLMMMPPTRVSEHDVKAAQKRNQPGGFSLLR